MVSIAAVGLVAFGGTVHFVEYRGFSNAKEPSVCSIGSPLNSIDPTSVSVSEIKLTTNCAICASMQLVLKNSSLDLTNSV